MDTKKPAPEYSLDLSADRSNVREVVIGILHAIFFHRLFTTLQPATHDVLDLTLPFVRDDDIEETIERRTNAFIRHIESTSTTTTTSTPTTQAIPGRGTLTLQFLERKRKKSWFATKTDEETVWETWTLDVTVTTARSEPEAVRNRRQMEMKLHAAAMRILSAVDGGRGYVPPITTTETNPFPFQIWIGGKSGGMGGNGSGGIGGGGGERVG